MWGLAALAWAVAVGPGCGTGRGSASAREPGGHGLDPATGLLRVAPVRVTTPASAAFWRQWGDGKAELSAYRIVTPRYGAARAGTAVLIYVTEPMDRRTWLKDDRGAVPEAERLNVLKLNHSLAFRTGVYPYSVMTSVFSPVDGVGRERFAPTKITFSAQEWCGHVYELLHATAGAFASQLRSYFSVDGERSELVAVRPGTLYEDALLIQLRELDGAFADGKDWSGELVPALWSVRKAHQPLRPVRARIQRTAALRQGIKVTRFELRLGAITRTIDVEQAYPRRILGWTGSDGERASLLKTARLAYWQLNRPGDEAQLKALGLAPDGTPPPEGVPAATRKP
ncbi:MAG: hypothetical protein IT371_00670 [Deltaproteobacteria bacterium]|nr:hypothetical protein [Deltaproteobacteria bacterium]